MSTFEVKIAEDNKNIEIVLPNGKSETIQPLFKIPIVNVILNSRMKDHEKSLRLWSDVLEYRLPETYSWLAREAEQDDFGAILNALFEISQKKLEEEVEQKAKA